MTPAERQDFEQLKRQVETLLSETSKFIIFKKDVVIGKKSQKIGLWNTTPVVQPTAIADVAAGGADSDGTARAKINAILAALRLPGFIAT